MNPITNGMKLSQVRGILNETISVVNSLVSEKPVTDESLTELGEKCASISIALDDAVGTVTQGHPTVGATESK
mgnify:CR=1 FL=1